MNCEQKSFSFQLVEVRAHLEGARQVFLAKIGEQARQIVWVEKILYSPVSEQFPFILYKHI